MLSARTRGDDGVVAVLTALLVTFVLLPVCALGLSTYVRSGVDGEMQRAADAGSLAAATALLFVDATGLNFTSDGAQLAAASVPACNAAQRSLGGSWTPSKDEAPLSAAFAATAPVTCTTGFSRDASYPDCITHLVANAQAVLDTSVAAAMRVVTALGAVAPVSVAPVTTPAIGAVQTVTSPAASTTTSATSLLAAVQAVVTSRVALAQRVFALVPAAESDGLVVILQHQVHGPMDALLGRTGPSTVQVTSTSRRLFKPLLPSSASLLKALNGKVPAADPTLSATLAGATDSYGQPLVSATERLVVEALQAVLASAVDRLVLAGQTLEGVDDTVAQQLTPASIENTMIRSLHDDLAARVPGLPPAVLDLMLAQPAPTMRLNPINPTCQGAARELVSALDRALQLNDDPDQQDHVSCLTDELLKLQGATSDLANTCVTGLFRAQLRPGPQQLLQVLP